MADPTPYLSKRVLVRGYLTQDPHGPELWDDNCPLNVLRLREPPETAKSRRFRLRLQYYSSLFGDKRPRVAVICSAVLTYHSPATRFYTEKYTLEAAVLVAVSPPRA